MSRFDIKSFLEKSGGVALAPSILSADFLNLGDEIIALETAGADMIHLDIMDGHFVDEISFGAPIAKAVLSKTNLPTDAHLMTCEPIKYGKTFANLGVDIITTHLEILDSITEWQRFKREMNTSVGLAVNPETEIKFPESILEHFDLILVMSVHPGFSGQKFIPEVLPKIEMLSNLCSQMNLQKLIQVDGGIDESTINLVLDAGANLIVAGNGFFKPEDFIVPSKTMNPAADRVAKYAKMTKILKGNLNV